jgi:plastocyanin
MNHVVRGAALAVVAADNSTAHDQPPGTAVAPKGSDSPVANWSKPIPYEKIIATGSSATAKTQNATLAYGQEAVSIAPGSSNPSATEFFTPKEISVTKGSTVTWTNDDTTIHTVVEGTAQGGSGETPAFDSSIIAPKGTWDNTFDTAGEFDYYCSLHPFMTGKVTVT